MRRSRACGIRTRCSKPTRQGRRSAGRRAAVAPKRGRNGGGRGVDAPRRSCARLSLARPAQFDDQPWRLLEEALAQVAAGVWSRSVGRVEEAAVAIGGAVEGVGGPEAQFHVIRQRRGLHEDVDPGTFLARVDLVEAISLNLALFERVDAPRDLTGRDVLAELDLDLALGLERNDAVLSGDRIGDAGVPQIADDRNAAAGDEPVERR